VHNCKKSPASQGDSIGYQRKIESRKSLLQEAFLIFRFMGSFQRAKRQFTNGGKVESSVFLSRLARVFADDDVGHPMQVVPNAAKPCPVRVPFLEPCNVIRGATNALFNAITAFGKFRAGQGTASCRRGGSFGFLI
jgi:hypothetical protein